MPHNKKRNAVLAYELLIRSVANAVVEKNDKFAQEAIKVIRTSFKNGSELNKEFRLASALIDEKVSSDVVAVRVLTECQLAARTFDKKKLEAEKNALYERIEKLGDKDFWSRKIDASDYQMYATVHQLLSAFRGTGSKNIDHVVSLEKKIIEHLTKSDVQANVSYAPDHDEKTLKLAVRLMTEKVNEKYSGVMTDRQKNIVNAYAQFRARKNESSKKDLIDVLRESDARLTQVCTGYTQNNSGESARIVSEVFDASREANESLAQSDEITDASVARRLMQEKLCDEIEGKDD